MGEMTEQIVFGAMSREEAERKFFVNPCIGLYGRDALSRTCKSCKHLFAKQYSKRYWKCDLRKNTNGPGTDHRINWPACGKYERKEPRK